MRRCSFAGQSGTRRDTGAVSESTAQLLPGASRAGGSWRVSDVQVNSIGTATFYSHDTLRSETYRPWLATAAAASFAASGSRYVPPGVIGLSLAARAHNT